MGTVLKNTGQYSQDGGIEGVSVTVEAEGVRRQTATDSLGHYEISALDPGRYKVEISKAGFDPDSVFNQRWSGKWVLKTQSNVMEPEKAEPGSVLISKNACTIRDLAMWAAGSITGTVRAVDGKPVGGVTIQAFALDDKNQRESRPLTTGKTEADGTYTIQTVAGRRLRHWSQWPGLR